MSISQTNSTGSDNIIKHHGNIVLITATLYSIFQPFWRSFSREIGQILLHIVNVTAFHHFRNVMMS